MINLAEYKNIAIINFRNLGDMICTMPLLKYCRQKAPNSIITTILGKGCAPLGPFLNDSDKIIALPTKKTYDYKTFIKYALKLRNSFDLVICANTPRKASDLFIWLLHPRNSLAYTKNTWHGKLIKTRIPFDVERKKKRHCALDFLNLLFASETLPKELIPKITLKEELKEIYKARIQEINKIGRPLVFVSVSNNRYFCLLGIEEHAKILNRLHDEFNCSVLISHLPKDANKAFSLAQKLEMPNIALATPDFSEFMAVLDAVDLCLIGEGGIMHLAAALNKPQVALFSKTSIIEWSPLSDKAVILQHPENVNFIDQEMIYSALRNIVRNFLNKN